VKKFILSLSAVILSSLYILPVSALSLGEMKVESTMGQPFRATVALVGLTDGDVVVKQLSNAAFEDDSNHVLNDLKSVKKYSLIPTVNLNVSVKQVAKNKWEAVLTTSTYANEPLYVIWLELSDGKETFSKMFSLALDLPDLKNNPIPPLN